MAQNSSSQRLWARAPAQARRGSVIMPGLQPGAERRRLHAGDRVAVGEDHLAGDAVGVERLVADVGVEGALQADLVVALPLLDVLAVDLLDHGPVLVAGRRATRRTRRAPTTRGRRGSPRRSSPACVSDDTITYGALLWSMPSTGFGMASPLLFSMTVF